MRRPVLTGFLLAVAALAHSAATGSDVGGLPGASATRQAEASPLPLVDIEFSIAVDISYSMDPDELATTRRLSQALVSPEFLRALKNLRYRRLR